MTLEERLTEKLIKMGLFENQAKEVLSLAKKEPALATIKWGYGEDQYPAEMNGLIWLFVKKHGLEWIDANCPNAWFRGMFVPAE
jgi:hypothetical protein